MSKLRSDSFAARLTPAQRDELFEKLAGGMSLDEAAAMVGGWTKAEGWKKPSRQAISEWYTRTKVERRYIAAKESALVAQANCPADYDDQARRALGQAKFLAVLEDLEPKEVAALEKNEIAREKLALEKQRLALDTRVQRLSLTLDRSRLLLERARGGEKSEDLQQQIDLALEEIEKMKHGEAAA